MSWRPPQGALGELVQGAREDCAARRRARPTLESTRRSSRPGFLAALREDRGTFPLICEVKRSSPSVGEIRQGADAARTAQGYVEAGARCVSVLTEGRRFKGSLEDLRQVRAAVPVPLLRKDFLVDPYMVAEAAEAGADAVLLIVAALPPTLLVELSVAAEEAGLEVLLELIYERDLEALALRDWPLVGVNARDLETLEVDPERFSRLCAQLPAAALKVAESGVRSSADVVRLKAAGAQAALVGEALMRAADPVALVRSLAGARP